MMALGMVFFLTSCNTNPIQKKWKVKDVKIPNVTAALSAFKQLTGSKKISNLIPKSFLQNGLGSDAMIGMVKQATFEFKKDQKCILSFFDQKTTGKYRLSEDKKTLTITPDVLKIGSKLDVKEFNANNLTLEMHLNGQSLTFILQPE